MAIRKTKGVEEKKAARPVYKQNSKMKNYTIIYDDKMQTTRLGFYKNKIKDQKISSSSQYYTVDLSTQYRIDLISLEFYGTPIYDWVIKDANNISDPIKDLYVGRKLIIPDLNVVGA